MCTKRISKCRKTFSDSGTMQKDLPSEKEGKFSDGGETGLLASGENERFADTGSSLEENNNTIVKTGDMVLKKPQPTAGR